jgi:hypothetical protein
MEMAPNVTSSPDVKIADLIYQALNETPGVWVGDVDRTDQRSMIEDLSSAAVDGHGIDLIKIAQVVRAHVIQSLSTSTTSIS